MKLKDKEEIEAQAVQARERMILSNLRLVVKISKQYLNRGMSMADLIEEGNIGLMRAVEGYDPEMETRFSTYASWWIKQAIRRTLNNTVQPVHIPAYMVAMIAEWKRAHTELEHKHGRPPTPAEMAEHMKISDRKVRLIRRAVKASHSSHQAARDENSLSLDEMLADYRASDESMLNIADQEMIVQLLSQIDQRDAMILRLRYGLDKKPPMTLKEIGREVGLTRERVRQLERAAISKLRSAMETML